MSAAAMVRSPARSTRTSTTRSRAARSRSWSGRARWFRRRSTASAGREGPSASDDDLLLAAFYDDAQYRALKEAGPITTEYPLMETPLLTLVKELTARPTIKSFQLKAD